MLIDGGMYMKKLRKGHIQEADISTEVAVFEHKIIELIEHDQICVGKNILF
jgi:hypothetical protein